MSEKRTGTGKMGWCMSGQHVGVTETCCPGVSVTGRVCTCDCHKEKT